MANTASPTLTDQLTDQAKQLAPWRSGLPWWVVLIEGVVLGIVGLLIVLDPAKANLRVGLLLAILLLVSGILQSWMLMRAKAPETVDGVLGARAALGIFPALVVLWLFMGDSLTIETGLLILGLGALCYGLLGIFLVFNSSGGQRNSALLETIFFTAFGAIVLYTRYGGPAVVTTAVTWIGWLALLSGVGLAFYSFIRRNQANEQEAKAESAAAAAGASVDRVAAQANETAKATAAKSEMKPPTTPGA